MVLVKALAVWFVMVLVAIANGLLREKILNVYLGESMALPVSGALLSILILLIIYLAMNLFKDQNRLAYFALGVFWVGLTLMFEYGFGYFVRGIGLREISQVFNVFSGNLFTLVIMVTLFGPQLIARYKSQD